MHRDFGRSRTNSCDLQYFRNIKLDVSGHSGVLKGNGENKEIT